MTSPVQFNRQGIQHGQTTYNVAVDFMSTEGKAIVSDKIGDDRMNLVKRDAALLYGKMILDKNLNKHFTSSSQIQIIQNPHENYISINTSKGKIKLKTPAKLVEHIDRIKDDIFSSPGEPSKKTIRGEKIEHPAGSMVITLNRLDTEKTKASSPKETQKSDTDKKTQARQLNEEFKKRFKAS